MPATAAPLDLLIRRNDNVFEYRLRVIGPNLAGTSLRAQIRRSGDSRPLLAGLELVTDPDAEGVQLAGTELIDGRWVNDVRIRINKPTRQALPYAAENGATWEGAWVMAIGGITRIQGMVRVPAHALDSEAAPLNQAPMTSKVDGGLAASGATLTIAEDDGATLVIDGADLLAPSLAKVTEAAGQAQAAAGIAQAAADLVAVTVSNPADGSALALSLRNKLGFEFARVGMDGSVSTSAWSLGPSAQPGFTIVNRLGFVLFDQASGPATASVSAVTTASVAPIIGDEIFLVSDRPLSLYPRGILTTRGDADTALVSIASRIGLPSRPFVATSNQAVIALDPAIMGATADLIVRPVGSPSSRLYKSLTVNKKTVPIAPGSQSPKVMLFGDSISHYQTGAFLKALLESWGFTPSWVGTINGSSTGTTGSGGPLGETRPGWSLYGDLLGHAPNADDNDVSGGIVPVGGEAAYLALSNDDRRKAQPFLRPYQAGDVAERVVTIGGTQYTFDFRFYLNRFSLADPDVILLNFEKNDENENVSVATAISNVGLGYPILLNAIREALPAARIVVWASASPRHLRTTGQDGFGAYGDDAWDALQALILKGIVSMVRSRRATDPLLHLCSVWAHQSQEVGWSLTLGAADTYGVHTAAISDTLHPQGVTRDQHCEALAAAIVNLA
jgi:hypothetical protein